eukprot:CAMPEP_0184418342 /NCGR_PEP_ID=MMETSP0738-20130409/26458_1 /TAXON_ID=385413 /ORGANISM="Thalassiosira miniscula, Strain CCMP1093" /LENGTH=59 /DNA_ID=CAMNT_0026778437 /DNA_START=10 /DNA_END=190 /DNA_ORIENTATION=-
MTESLKALLNTVGKMSPAKATSGAKKVLSPEINTIGMPNPTMPLMIPARSATPAQKTNA